MPNYCRCPLGTQYRALAANVETVGNDDDADDAFNHYLGK
jgi:hypothetical protein